MSEQSEAEPAGAEPAGHPPSAGSGRFPVRALVIALAVAVVLGGIGGYALDLYQRARQATIQPPLPSGIPASVPPALAMSMQLSPLQTQPAPGFTLTDQNGRQVSLASLRGRVVVLEFMDPHCTDICPLVSQEFINAYRDLGPAASNAVFLAVNVNPYYRSVADVASFSSAHGLSAIGSWHFLTGDLAALKAVWADYQVQVQAPSRTGDIIHTSLLFFIDRAGRERFVAVPMADHTTTGKSYLPAADLAAWGRGIALVTRSLTG